MVTLVSPKRYGPRGTGLGRAFPGELLRPRPGVGRGDGSV